MRCDLRLLRRRRDLATSACDVNVVANEHRDDRHVRFSRFCSCFACVKLTKSHNSKRSASLANRRALSSLNRRHRDSSSRVMLVCVHDDHVILVRRIKDENLVALHSMRHVAS